MSIGTLFTYTVYHYSSSVDNIVVHTHIHIVHTFKAELQCHVTHFYLKHCSRHDRRCGQFCLHFGQIVHTFQRRVHCSHKTLFTYLTESVDNFVHTFIKLSTFWGRVHCSHKTLFTYLIDSVDKIVHTFIKLSTLSENKFYCSP